MIIDNSQLYKSLFSVAVEDANLPVNQTMERFLHDKNVDIGAFTEMINTYYPQYKELLDRLLVLV
jgi:hypothetical protein